MPERSLTVATYAAGASLAAITLIYVFAPTYFLDGDQSSSSTGVFGSRKKGIVGLSNPANDCFINSILQALAGLKDLRVYLIQETHRRSLDNGLVYARVVPDDVRDTGEAYGSRSGKKLPDWKIEGLQMGIVTRGLKDMLDALNERPIYKKTISAAPFVRTLETAFRQRISRQQQDAQEFLQVVAERLCDEYHAGRKARRFAMGKLASTSVSRAPQFPIAPPDEGGEAGIGTSDGTEVAPEGEANTGAASALPASQDGEEQEDDSDEGFPLEGKLESQIECLTCGFKPRPTESTFCSLTLNVPQTSATTLGACFDGMFKTEYIDDFKCEKCRLLYAVEVLQASCAVGSETAREEARAAIAKLQLAINTDPENPPPDVDLPELRLAPKRRIARHTRLTLFPRILAIHLSRSIFDATHMSQKNSAKVSFPERLPLGGLLRQRKYKLRGLVTHKGSHHSGHYETFRRQDVSPPFSNPSTFQPSEVYCKAANAPSSPRIGASGQKSTESSPPASSSNLVTATTTAASLSTPSLNPSDTAVSPGAAAATKDAASPVTPGTNDTSLSGGQVGVDSGSVRSITTAVPGSPPHNELILTTSNIGWRSKAAKPSLGVKPKRQKPHDKWWRISDDKVKLASTSDVLGMQKEVYLLFYELDEENR